MSVRYVEQVAVAGELVLSRDGGGWRHYLDGRPVECGTTLRHVGAVPGDGSTFFSRARPPKLVRYESRLDGAECDVVLVFTDGSERFATTRDRFEWIPDKARRTDGR